MKKKILIVEDDSLISTIFRMFLKELGYDLLEIVADGKEAMRLCEILKPDIILMDVHLSGSMDGIQTTELIKSKFDIPVIFLSSDTEESTIQRVINIHSYGYLVKPIDKRELGISIELAFYKHKFDMDQKMRETRFRNFITDSPEAIIVINENGLIEYLNCLGLKIFKTAYIEDLMGLPLLSFVDDHYAAIFKERLETSLTMGKGIAYTHLKLKTIHGELVDIGLTGAQIEFNGKKNLQLIVRDITQEFAYRQLLAEKVNIINNLVDGVVTFDLNGIVKSWNCACERIFEIEEAQVLGKEYEEVIILGKEKTFIEGILSPVRENGNYQTNVTLIINNEKKDIKLTANLLKNDIKEETGIVCYIKEIEACL